ncbi:sensor histidine kinase N-terminal domain-containing protein [Piscinibacter sp. Jin2]|uniref:histidine kinase n=1 Tax=Aquariibacter lacus TaxID=2801332 RepID=A0A9X0XG82_9BURK|nr:sensor histidine kinase [Piscinibacter lacus]MBL0718955.1 sensor histidine kinase N-terminal domain-containing protein [Piscinibacter lacus]
MVVKTREQRSLFGEILDWMLAPLLLLWPMSVALTWLVAQDIAHHPYDRALGETARALAQQLQVLPGGRRGPPRLRFELPPAAVEILRSDAPDESNFQVLGSHGELLGGVRDLLVPVEEEGRAPLGELRFRDDLLHGEPVRVAYLWVAPTETGSTAPALVQVAETLGKRSRLANEIIKGVILPQFVILPVAVLLVWFALARGIAPLNELQHRIRRREAGDLSPIDERAAPEEVAPLVRAINDLLARLDHSLTTQKRFLADAAHQLRTPLAGLRTQAELIQRDIDHGETDLDTLKRSVLQIARSSQRAAHMVNQLLAMARAEQRHQPLPREAVDLARLATEVSRDFVPQALERRIDLGFEPPAAGQVVQVLAHPLLLGELIRNLVDNALRYTPPGGTVTVRVGAGPGEVWLQVEDSGPGIPPAERELVFQPFYRSLGTEVDGSGLGLAIVAEIARQHEGQIGLDTLHAEPLPEGTGPGLRVTLRLPALGRTRIEPAAPPDPDEALEVHP